jgi:hypothetical protein
MLLEPWEPISATKARQSSDVEREVKASPGAFEIRRFTGEKLERAVANARAGF